MRNTLSQRCPERDRLTPIASILLVQSLAAWIFALLAGGLASAQTPPPNPSPAGLTPPMGWNSWDSYGLTINEAQFKENVAWFTQHLKPAGWQYVVIDEGWYLRNPESGGKPAWQFTLSRDGRYMPATNRFPSAEGDVGFKPLADAVHALGLKFGIHIIRGIPREAVEKNTPIAASHFHAEDAADRADTCRWNSDNYGVKAGPAGQAYYDSIASLYASWGVDLVKIDCITVPYKQDEIHMFSSALARTGRPIILSLSPGPTPLEKADDLRTYAQMWRISDDFWDSWTSTSKEAFPQSLLKQFPLLAGWATHPAPGHFPDADMLPIGYLGPNPGYGPPRQTRLTHDEQQTLLTLWSISRSPLVIGANLTRMDDWTTALLTNPDIIAVDQHSSGNHEIEKSNGAVVWSAHADSSPDLYIAVFNTADQPQKLTYTWQQLGLPHPPRTVRELWTHDTVQPGGSLSVDLAAHASALYRIAN